MEVEAAMDKSESSPRTTEATRDLPAAPPSEASTAPPTMPQLQVLNLGAAAAPVCDPDDPFCELPAPPADG